jgi:hypothetical protein
VRGADHPDAVEAALATAAPSRRELDGYPVVPEDPVVPVAPVDPVDPVGPVTPVEPVDPVALAASTRPAPK